MKFVKLTNTGRYRGDPLYINLDWIVSVFEEASEQYGSLTTVVFGGPGNGTRWVVEESAKEVLKKIEEASS
jgi:uncharacterized protein YlzI (FlbEa/FlbD family)